MKSEEIILILKTFQKTLKRDSSDFKVLEHLIDRIKDMDQGLKFYSQGHYDNGFVARKALDLMTSKDLKMQNRYIHNASNIRKSAWESES